MKTLLHAILFLFILSSCRSGKTFTDQRYTHFGHKKPVVTTGTKQQYARITRPVNTPAEPVTVNVPAATETGVNVPVSAGQTAPRTVNPEITASAAPVTAVKSGNFVANTIRAAKTTYTKHAFKKQVQVNKQNKRGLLFGIINTLLSIILLVVVAFIIVFLVLLLV